VIRSWFIAIARLFVTIRSRFGLAAHRFSVSSRTLRTAGSPSCPIRPVFSATYDVL